MKNNIIFDLNNLIISYKGEKKRITHNLSNDYLWNKLYNEQGAREVFLYTGKPIEDFIYSTTTNHPEILNNISIFIKNNFYANLNLAIRWEKLVTQRVIYEIIIPIDQFVGNDFKTVSREVIIEEISRYKDRCVNDYFILKINPNFKIKYKDIKLIN